MERFFSDLLKKNKLTALLELGRPWNGAIVAIFSILGTLFAGNTLFTNFLLAPLITFFIYLGGASLNDISDFEVDMINMPYRPLERYQLTISEAKFFTLITYLIGIILSALISLSYFLTILLMVIVTYAYSMPPTSLKKKGILGNFTVAFDSTFVTIFSGYVLVTNNLFPPLQFLIYLISLTLFFTFFNIIKDFKDLKGDTIENKKTIAVTVGPKVASVISIIGTIIFFLLNIFLFNFLFQNILFIITSLLLMSLLLYLEYEIYKEPTEKVGDKIWGRSRIIMLMFSLSLLIFFFI